jgi:hypothetical protein
MKMVSKITMALLAGALALPVAGIAEEKVADAPKPSVGNKQKPTIAAPADCVVTGKNNSKGKGNTVKEKRKEIHARKGIKSGEEKLLVHDLDAAHEHGRHENHK